MELMVGATFTLGWALELMGVLLWPTARPDVSPGGLHITQWDTSVFTSYMIVDKKLDSLHNVTGHGKTGLVHKFH